MKKGGDWARVYTLLGLAKNTFWLVLTIIVIAHEGANELGISNIPVVGNVLERIRLWLQVWGSSVFLMALALWVVANSIRRRIGDPWVYDAAQRALNSLRDEFFDRLEPSPYNRATLFKGRKWAWRAIWRRRQSPRRWLVPVLRSGHTTKKTPSMFRIGDNPDRCEGVAGQAWTNPEVWKVVHDLPDVGTNAHNPDYETYASRVYVSPELVQKWRPGGRSFCGIAIEVKGNPWGAVILDSRDPQGVTDATVTRHAHALRLFADFMASLAERI